MVGMGYLDQCVGALTNGESNYLGGAELRDHHTGVMTRRRYDRALGQLSHNAGYGGARNVDGRAKADQRMGVRPELGAGDEVLVSTYPGIWRPSMVSATT